MQNITNSESTQTETKITSNSLTNTEIQQTKVELSIAWKKAKNSCAEQEEIWSNFLTPLEQQLREYYKQRDEHLKTYRNNVKISKQRLTDFNNEVKLTRGY